MENDDARALLEGFFNPKGVVVFGVSTKKENLAKNIVGNLIEFRFKGPIFLVGQKEGYLFGHRIITNPEEIPEGDFLAMVLTPARTVPSILEVCGKKGIRFVVVQSGGFRELGAEGERLEMAINEIAKKYGIRFIGPNCLGILSPISGLGCVFMPVKDYWRHGGVSVAAQSGGVGVTYLYQLASENIGLSRFASIGNKNDIDETDFLRIFGEDESTKAIALYLESISDGRKFYETLKAQKKPVVVQKANRTFSSKEIAYSHTAALATDDRIVDCAIKQAGAQRVYSMAQMAAFVKALLMPPCKGRNLAIIARSGGHAVLAADAADDAGFLLPPYPPEYIASVPSSFASEVIKRTNPLDLGDLYDFDAYAKILEGACRLEGFDAVLMVHEYFAVIEGEESRKLVPKAQELAQKYQKPVALVLVTDERETAYLKRVYDYPFFTSIEDALWALGAVRRHFEAKERHDEPFVFDEETAERLRKVVHEHAQDMALGLLLCKKMGLCVPDFWLAKGIEDIPEDVKFPVAVKALTRKAVHKSDEGALLLGVKDRAEMEMAIRQLEERFAPFGYGEYLLVQSMAPKGSEWIVGGMRDLSFGPVVITGAGGIFVEVLKDTALRLAPVSKQDAMEMLKSLKAMPLLEGVRGIEKANKDALCDVIAKVSALLCACEDIKEIDLNPCIASQNQIFVVDARVRVG
jgi:acetyltransferase